MFPIDLRGGYQSNERLDDWGVALYGPLIRMYVPGMAGYESRVLHQILGLGTAL